MVRSLFPSQHISKQTKREEINCSLTALAHNCKCFTKKKLYKFFTEFLTESTE